MKRKAKTINTIDRNRVTNEIGDYRTFYKGWKPHVVAHNRTARSAPGADEILKQESSAECPAIVRQQRFRAWAKVRAVEAFGYWNTELAAKMLAAAAAAHSFSSSGGVGHLGCSSSVRAALGILKGVAGSIARPLLNRTPFLLAEGDGVGYGLDKAP